MKPKFAIGSMLQSLSFFATFGLVLWMVFSQSSPAISVIILAITALVCQGWLLIRNQQIARNLDKTSHSPAARDTLLLTDALVSGNQRRLAALLEHNLDAISLLDASFRVIYRSPVASNITGWSDDDIKNQPITRHIHPDDLAKVQAVIADFIKYPGKAIATNFRNQHKDGHYLWVEGTVINLLDDADVNAIVFNFRDVTARIEAEKKLALSELRFRSLIENSAEGISLLDEHANVIYRSPPGRRLLGENPLDTTISFAHPDGKEGFRNKFAETLSKPGVPVPYTVQYRHANGHFFWAEGKFTNLLHVEGVNAIVANYHEITERVEAEQKLASSERRFRAMIENNQDVIMLVDEHLNTTYRSPSATLVNGWTDEESIGTSAISRIHPDDLPGAKALIQEMMNRPGKGFNALFRNQHKDGSTRWLEGVVTNLLEDAHVKSILLNFRDITERVEAEAKNRASEERFRLSLDNMLEGVQIIGFNWEYLYVNDAVCRQGRYPREELLGFTMMEKYPGIETTPLFEACRRCLHEKVSLHIENEFAFPDGSSGWFELSLQPIPEGVFILSVDISARKKAAELVTASEVRFRSLIENISDGIVMNNADGTILYQSPSVERILGYTLEERKNKRVPDFIHPDNLHEIQEMYRMLADTPGVAFPFEYRFLHKNGNYIWLEGVVTNLINNPAVNTYVANYRDITARKIAEETIRQSERIYKTIASNIPGSLVALLDKDCRFMLIEGDLIEQLNFSKKELLGNLAGESMDAATFDFFFPYCQAVLNGEYCTMEKTMNGYDIITRFIPIKDSSNLVQHIMVVTLDVTELKNAQRNIIELNQGLEEKISQRTQELKTVNDELESFSYSVSHDLRAPLRAIIGFAAILEEDYSSKLDEEARRITGVIKGNTIKMATLIDDLLTFSRLRRHEMMKSKINMGQLVQDAIAVLENARHTEAIPPQFIIGALPHAMADLTALRQVWMNLLDNAVKYSSKKEQAIIEVGAYESGQQLVYFIKDNGAGFDSRYAEKLFHVFQRLHSEQEFAGTGIGLAIVEKLFLNMAAAFGQ